MLFIFEMDQVRSSIQLKTCLFLFLFACLSSFVSSSDLDYGAALKKSIIFLEAQRSGKLPKSNRVPWRGDSALDDGKLENVDLAGGYYDAGDNVKYGLPLAFTVTTLSWAGIHYKAEIKAAGETDNLRAAVRWGTDFLLKASAKNNQLYVQVGDPVKDHECWMRPENMETPRTVLKVDANTPGTEIVAETSAALAAASVVFRGTDPIYSRRLVTRAEQLFKLAKDHKGSFDGECPFYCSNSGFNDELLWAATWLYTATKKSTYMDYIQHDATSASVSEFSWDLKYAGAQIILSNLYMEGKKKELEKFKTEADSFICSNLPDSPHHQVYISPGGMIHLRDGANTQYVTSAAFLFSVYADFLTKHKQHVSCGDATFPPPRLMAFAKKQMDYILGDNPKSRSYMVGFGKNPPTQAHHRGASVPKMAPNAHVSCPMSFVYWYNKDEPNCNELTGAIVGGPDKNDEFEDKRTNSAMTEPCTYINSLAVGVLAKLAVVSHSDS